MSPSEKELTLDTVAGGAAPALFEHELRKVLNNIHDPNTKAKAGRTITLTVEITPDEKRHRLDVTVAAKSKLAPHRAEQGVAFSGKHSDGRVVAVTYDPKQRELWAADEDADVTPIRENDEETA